MRFKFMSRLEASETISSISTTSSIKFLNRSCWPLILSIPVWNHKEENQEGVIFQPKLSPLEFRWVSIKAKCARFTLSTSVHIIASII